MSIKDELVVIRAALGRIEEAINEGGADPLPDELEFPVGLVWLHTSVREWPVTGRLSNVAVYPDRVFLDYSASWPVVAPAGVEIWGNPWVIAQVDGRWYAATWEWMRPHQTTKRVTADDIGPLTKRDPLRRWVPNKGERVGFFVSTPARDATRTVDQRTNVVWVTWP